MNLEIMKKYSTSKRPTNRSNNTIQDEEQATLLPDITVKLTKKDLSLYTRSNPLLLQLLDSTRKTSEQERSTFSRNI